MPFAKAIRSLRHDGARRPARAPARLAGADQRQRAKQPEHHDRSSLDELPMRDHVRNLPHRLQRRQNARVASASTVTSSRRPTSIS